MSKQPIRVVKGIAKEVFDFIASADKKQLQQMKRQLTAEIEQGLLIGPQYTIELNLINSRLG